jgi:gamma-glutamyltranspeptidase/glutathione hydrolase
VAEAGGPLRADDLASWGGPEWVAPPSVRFRDVDVFEMPPPGQGVVVLESLAIYGAFNPSSPAEDDHRAIESLKLAIADASAVVADPVFAPPRATRAH